MKEVLADLRMERLKGDEAIDCGAEEELYRRVGQQAAGELLANRWQEADAVPEAKCEQCQRNMKAMGHREVVVLTSHRTKPSMDTDKAQAPSVTRSTRNVGDL